jgi:hypothetical protein
MVALVAACWAALAAAGPVLAKANGLPASQQSVRAGFEHSGSHIARALLVIAFFVLIGLLAGVLTQGTVGTISAAAGATVAILALGTVPSLGKYTPATFVEGWMGFSSVSRSAGALPDNFWSRFTDSHGVVPGHVFGLVGLVATMAVGAWIAWRRFGRMDVA